MRNLPRGTVTFLFTDIEGSTRLLKRLGERYGDVLDAHGEILRRCCEEAGGQEIDTQGDSFFFAFARARDAVDAAVAGQKALSEHRWPEDSDVRVRMGLHTGEPVVGPDRYIGLGVHKAARIGAVANGGQILLSNTTRELVEGELAANYRLADLGEYRLKDIDRPEHVFQVKAPGLRQRFPRLRAETVSQPRAWARKRPRGPRMTVVAFAGVLGVAGAVAALAVVFGGGAGGTLRPPQADVGEATAPGRDPDAIVLGRSIGAIELGMSEADVKRRYGSGREQQWLAGGRNGARLIYSGPGGGLTASFYEGRVVQIATSNSHYVTVNGIRVGSVILLSDRPEAGVTVWRGFLYEGQQSWCLRGERAATQLVQGTLSTHISKIFVTDVRLLAYLPAHTDPNPYSGGADFYCGVKPL